MIIETMSLHIQQINLLIANLNESIRKNNAAVQNKKTEQTNCSEDIWMFFVHELREAIEQYNRNTNGLNSGIKKLLGKFENKKIGIKKSSVS